MRPGLQVARDENIERERRMLVPGVSRVEALSGAERGLTS